MVLCIRERCGKSGGGQGLLIQNDRSGTLACSNDQLLLQAVENGDFILRKLTPTECARLQGMPDWWCSDVPHKDTPEYKMWGNGIALPCALYVMEGLAELEKE